MLSVKEPITARLGFIILTYNTSMHIAFIFSSISQNNDLQLKLTRSRNNSMLELDKGLQERSEKFEREKGQLIEHTKQLRLKLDKAEADNALMRSSSQEQENELKELRENKLLLNQWERQIHDIIQWVSEEKDAR